MSLQDKIAKAKALHESVEPTDLDVEVGGELVKLTFRPIWGGEWADIVALHEPRPGSTTDAAVGYNTEAVALDYPVDAVTVDGETPSIEDWRELLSVISGVGRRNIGTVLYGLNHIEPAKRLAAAGKAFKG